MTTNQHTIQTATGGSLPTIIDGSGHSILAIHDVWRTPVFASPEIAQRVLAFLNRPAPPKPNTADKSSWGRLDAHTMARIRYAAGHLIGAEENPDDPHAGDSIGLAWDTFEEILYPEGTTIEYGMTWEYLTYADDHATERTVWEKRERLAYRTQGSRDSAYRELTDTRRGQHYYRNVKKTRRVVLPSTEEPDQ